MGENITPSSTITREVLHEIYPKKFSINKMTYSTYYGYRVSSTLTKTVGVDNENGALSFYDGMLMVPQDKYHDAIINHYGLMPF